MVWILRALVGVSFQKKGGTCCEGFQLKTVSVWLECLLQTVPALEERDLKNGPFTLPRSRERAAAL
jgi:hypothetical protein